MSEEQQISKMEDVKPSKTGSVIPINDSGKIVTKDHSELLRYCSALIEGAGVPKRFDTPVKLFAALMYVRDLRLPDTFIKFVANIHGTMTAFGDLPLALVQRSGLLSDFRELWFDQDYKTICYETLYISAS